MKTLTFTLLLVLPTYAAAETLSDADLKALTLLPENQSIASDQGSLERQLYKALSTLGPAVKGMQSKKVNMDMAKIEALKGTYSLSFKLSATTYTDKMVINQTSTGNDGEILGKGLYYVNQGDIPQPIICGYKPEALITLDADYICTTYNFAYQLFAFKLAGNSLTNGYYAIGLTPEATVSMIFAKIYPLIGSRMESDLSKDAIDEYSPLTGKLSLPSVKVGTEIYNVSMSSVGNNRFQLQSAVKVPSTKTGILDEYALFSGKLTLPNVKVGQEYYAVIMTYEGSQLFRVESVVKK